MTYHIWGDDFDFEELGRVGREIADYCEEVGDFYLIWKEKYGTIRYEMMFLRSNEEIEIIQDAIKIATDKYPHLKDEIEGDFYE